MAAQREPLRGGPPTPDDARSDPAPAPPQSSEECGPIAQAPYDPEYPARPFGLDADLCYNTRLLRPKRLKLPKGFNSWTQVLTDWGVSRAFSAVGLPTCFKDRPVLAAPFVAEIGAAIRHKLLNRLPVEATLAAERVTEPTYAQIGGPRYGEVRRTMQQAQEQFLTAWRTQCPTETGEDSPQVALLRAAMNRHQKDYAHICRSLEPNIKTARRQAARAYWSHRSIRGIPDTFFADAADHSASARMQRIHPPWWGAFLGRLQKRLTHGHPAEGHLLDALPQLRAAATKKTLAALIEEWRAEHNDEWGWYSRAHDRMLADRSGRKAKQLNRWFKARAPDYLNSEEERYSLHEELAERLAAADPWSVSLQERSRYAHWNEHWRN